jgi:hypothetical protein
MRAEFLRLLVSLIMVGGFSCAQAQGVGDTGAQAGSASGSDVQTNGNASTGKPMPTGRGPLLQPIPPAPSTTNPGQNIQQSPFRSQNNVGPVRTNPPQQPFGSR